MKISTKGRYGLRALLDLAVHSGRDMATLADIARRQEMSVGYLEQIFSALGKANIVIGTKGAQGGYVLGQPASKITVRTVLEVLEGDLFAIKEDRVENSEASAMQTTIRELVWDRMNTAAASALESLTLENLAEVYGQAMANEINMFYI
jgi:Rrf2 family transcriptional regulator, cysteine metabolism repressor